jgi:hypothetical protein
LPGINNNIPFQEQEPLRAFRGEYSDKYGNQWLIDAVGRPQDVEEFIAKQPFLLEAFSITEEELQKARMQAEEHGGKLSEPLYPAKIPEQMPGLQVNCYLMQPAVQLPYRVHFEIDPRPFYYQGFNLFGNDVTAIVNYAANGGTVWVYVSTPNGGAWSGPAALGTTAQGGVTPGSYCSVSVYTAQGDPSFTLSGDVYAA